MLKNFFLKKGVNFFSLHALKTPFNVMSRILNIKTKTSGENKKRVLEANFFYHSSPFLHLYRKDAAWNNYILASNVYEKKKKISLSSKLIRFFVIFFTLLLVRSIFQYTLGADKTILEIILNYDWPYIIGSLYGSIFTVLLCDGGGKDWWDLSAWRGRTIYVRKSPYVRERSAPGRLLGPGWNATRSASVPGRSHPAVIPSSGLVRSTSVPGRLLSPGWSATRSASVPGRLDPVLWSDSGGGRANTPVKLPIPGFITEMDIKDMLGYDINQVHYNLDNMPRGDTEKFFKNMGISQNRILINYIDYHVDLLRSQGSLLKSTLDSAKIKTKGFQSCTPSRQGEILDAAFRGQILAFNSWINSRYELASNAFMTLHWHDKCNVITEDTFNLINNYFADIKASRVKFIEKEKLLIHKGKEMSLAQKIKEKYTALNLHKKEITKVFNTMEPIIFKELKKTDCFKTDKSLSARKIYEYNEFNIRYNQDYEEFKRAIHPLMDRKLDKKN